MPEETSLACASLSNILFPRAFSSNGGLIHALVLFCESSAKMGFPRGRGGFRGGGRGGGGRGGGRGRGRGGGGYGGYDAGPPDTVTGKEGSPRPKV